MLHAPAVEADPDEDGTRSETFVVLHPTRAEVLIGGTFYAGEIKKSIFTLMNDRLPLEGVLPMHCSANVDDDGGVAIFFGLSGTGKTTLSADPERHLIGDDEHGWGDDGVFNFEGGCYAKVIRLSRGGRAARSSARRSTFGTVLENVVVDERRRARPRRRLEDREHARGVQARADRERAPDQARRPPEHVVFLTADAFGILPPIARLTRDQAMFYFLSGFTAKLAGTEIGVDGAAADVLRLLRRAVPAAAARGLRARCSARSSTEHGATRLAGQHGLDRRAVRRGRADADRRHARAAQRGAVAAGSTTSEYRTDPVFGFEVPVAVPGVDAGLLDPRSTWRDPEAYDRKARELARMFRENFDEVRARRARGRRPPAPSPDACRPLHRRGRPRRGACGRRRCETARSVLPGSARRVRRQPVLLRRLRGYVRIRSRRRAPAIATNAFADAGRSSASGVAPACYRMVSSSVRAPAAAGPSTDATRSLARVVSASGLQSVSARHRGLARKRLRHPPGLTALCRAPLHS